MVFHIGIAFSSSIWNASMSRVGIPTPSTTMSACLLSRPLPTPRRLSRPFSTPHPSSLYICTSAPICISHNSFPSLHCLHTFHLFVRLYVHGDGGMLLADPRSQCPSAFCCCVVVCVSQLTLPMPPHHYQHHAVLLLSPLPY